VLLLSFVPHSFFLPFFSFFLTFYPLLFLFLYYYFFFFYQSAFLQVRALLIVDGHCSRDIPDVWKEFNDNGVDVFMILPHTSHLVQPLDRNVNREIKWQLHGIVGFFFFFIRFYFVFFFPYYFIFSFFFFIFSFVYLLTALPLKGRDGTVWAAEFPVWYEKLITRLRNAITSTNILTSFRTTGIVPWDPMVVLQGLPPVPQELKDMVVCVCVF
jgi:hypothetical protein